MSVDQPERVDEARRISKVYRRYARSRRRRRTWAAENPGNVSIRMELREVGFKLAAPEIHGVGQVLDIGCGGGWWLTELARAGVDPRRLHGVDLLAARVAQARRALPGADLRVADARALPHGDGRFTLVLMFTVLSSLPDHESVLAALREASRVLEPGGLLLCYEPRVPNPFNRATSRVSLAELRSGLDGEVSATAVTVLPQLSRRLGRAAPRLYPFLRRFPPLLTHRLIAHRKP